MFFKMKYILIIYFILELNTNIILSEGVNKPPFLLSLNINISKNKLIKLIKDSASKEVMLFNSYETVDYQLSLQDLLFLFQRKRMNIINIREVFNCMAVNFNDLKNLLVLYDFDYECVKLLELNLKNLYLSFLSFLTESGIQMPQFHAILGLDEYKMSNAYVNGTDYELYQLLKEANFSQKFVDEMTRIIKSELFLGLLYQNNTISLLQRMELIIGSDVVSFMRNLGLSPEQLTTLLSLFIEDLQDLEHKPAFRDLSNALQVVQGQNAAFATWINNSQNYHIITVNSGILELYDIGFEYLMLTTVINNNQIILYPDNLLKLSNDLIALSIIYFDTSLPQVEIINPFQANNYCHYYTNSNKINIPCALVPSPANTDGTFDIIDLINSIHFVLGSPIICNNELVGVATKHYSNSRTAFGFYNSSEHNNLILASGNKSNVMARQKRNVILKNNFSLTRIWENFFTVLKGFLSNSCRC